MIALTLELPFQGFDISFEVDAKVTREDQDAGTLGVEFVELTERAHDLLVHFIDDLVRGKMATVDDTICRIDIPVTPISTKPEAESEQGSKRRWPIKTVLMTGFYLILGLGVFGYLGVLAHGLTMRLEVQSAVVSTPVSTVKMPVDGKVVPSPHAELVRQLRRGDVIARIENADLLNELEDKRNDLERAREMLARANEKFRIQQESHGDVQGRETHRPPDRPCRSGECERGSRCGRQRGRKDDRTPRQRLWLLPRSTTKLSAPDPKP